MNTPHQMTIHEFFVAVQQLPDAFGQLPAYVLLWAGIALFFAYAIAYGRWSKT